MEIVLARAGHYFNAGNGSCQTATVAAVFDDGGQVNLQVLQHDGNAVARQAVRVSTTPNVNDLHSSFHLTRDCPWGR